MTKRFQMDMTKGSIMKELIIFSIPLILTNILQSLFHTADILILGIFTSDVEVGSCGSTSAIINLVLGLFIGFSMGTNVVVAKYLGRKDGERVKKGIGTSIALCLISGLVVLLIGFFGARLFMQWTNCRPMYMEGAVKYMRVYFLGSPIVIFYNFCSAIMRASGDTTRPLIFLIIGGVLNIVLNIIFVLFGDAIAGVAIATIASQGVSALLCLICIIRNDGDCKFELKYFKIYKNELKEILIIGIPSGIQSCLFSFSNTIIQKNLNDLGIDEVVSANSLASQFDAFVYQTVHSIALSTLSFTSQNFGARDVKRIREVRYKSLIFITVAGLVVGGLIVGLSRVLCSIGINDNNVVGDKELILDYCFLRHLIMASTYFLCGWMDSLANVTRGVGKSFSAMVITLMGSCVFRILWVEFIIDLLNIKSATMIYLSWPISWVLTVTIYFITQAKLLKNVESEFERENKGIIF